MLKEQGAKEAGMPSGQERAEWEPEDHTRRDEDLENFLAVITDEQRGP